MASPILNFGLVTVSGTHGSSDTSIALTSGDGARLPDPVGGYAYPVTWWNATDYAHPADDPNVEIVSVTARSGDTLTVVRAQEGTSASTKNSSTKTYRMSLGITAAMWASLAKPKSFHQGLQLQTHRDSDVAAKQVELVDVDSIIMDDGTELRNDNGEWSGKIADITVAGAGGLDTGAETSSTWYEIYAIAKEDGTRNLLLHQSKLWAVNTGYVSGEDASQGIRSAVDNSTVKVAQGFTLSDSGTIPYIEAKLVKVGTPTGKIWFTIETNNAGKPSGSIVATSHAYDVSRLPTTAMTVRIPMKSSNVLSPSPTQYHLVAQGDWTISATNYVAWRMDGSAGTYTPGSKALLDSDTSTWTTDTDDDMIFNVALEQNASPVLMPTDYTQKCFLGWVYNDGSSDFVSFMQVNRSRRVTNLTATNCRVASISGGVDLVNLVSFLPPRHIIQAIISFSGTGTSAGLIAIGDLRATDISSVGDTTGAQVVIMASATTTRPNEFREVLIQTVGLMAMGTAGGYLWLAGFEW